jgi:hypothetical protein
MLWWWWSEKPTQLALEELVQLSIEHTIGNFENVSVCFQIESTIPIPNFLRFELFRG